MTFVQKAVRWMATRYGQDEFSRFLMISGLVIVLVTSIFSLPILNIIGLVSTIYALMRVLSTDKEKREAENRWFLKKKQSFTQSYHRMKNKMHQRKVYRFYKCPSCTQQLRVPKRKKKINITCPNCSHQFVKKT